MKNIKKLLTVVLATSMVIGCTFTALADASAEGQGTYEGGEMQYPDIAITLPTIPEGTYDYIADPNGLIALTEAAKYDDSEFSGGTGIFFLTTPKTDEAGSKNIYTNNSAALTVTSENAQDVDVTVKLEQKTAGDEGIAYAESATFDSEDKAKKLYLAVTDGAETDPQVDALSASAAATLTATVAGVPDNYEPSWDEDDGYGYVVKEVASGDPDLEWNECSFNLTGALNTGAEWGEEVNFPEIKVTWSYAAADEEEEEDEPVVVDAAPSIAESATFVKGTDLDIEGSLGAGELAATAITKVALGKTADGSFTDAGSDKVTISGGTVTILGTNYASVAAGSKRYAKVYFNDAANTIKTIELTISE